MDIWVWGFILWSFGLPELLYNLCEILIVIPCPRLASFTAILCLTNNNSMCNASIILSNRLDSWDSGTSSWVLGLLTLEEGWKEGKYQTKSCYNSFLYATSILNFPTIISGLKLNYHTCTRTTKLPQPFYKLNVLFYASHLMDLAKRGLVVNLFQYGLLP